MERVESIIFEQAGRTPDAVAVEHNGSRLSYAELRRQALHVGFRLRELGLEPGQAVGICQDRSLATLPLLLGVWSAGGVVVPISHNAPEKMVEWLIENSSPRLVVTDRAFEARVSAAVTNAGAGATAAVLSDELLPGEGLPTEELPLTTGDGGAGDDSCYVIYTSGSEGRPKGVVGSHRSLVHYLRWQAAEFAVTGADRFSQIAPLSFDFSLKELLVPLISGARVCIADRGMVMDAGKFLEWVAASEITVLCCVPTLLRSILQAPEDVPGGRALPSLRSVLISGDMLRWDDVEGWRRRFGAEMSLYNLYGPTESTVIKLFYPIPDARCEGSVNVPVGRPIEGADVVILNDEGRPCEAGQTGEVVIVSDWIARGYAAGSRLNGGSFCEVSHEGERRRAYRTGDLGRRLTGGEVELTGRKDRQVKIRGYRIELDEVESILSEHPGVKDAAVVAPRVAEHGGADGVPVIACFYTAEDAGLTEQEIKGFARERLLPQVLSLARFARLDALPLTTNGKVDRLLLESMAGAAEGLAAPAAPEREPRAEPANYRSRVLAMWEELLSVETIEPEANFFELGGDSMTAIRLLRRLREEVHPGIKLGDLYAYPSFAGLSERLGQLLEGGQVENKGAHV
ncbi:MAG: non-ribosomal peptide synthetase [Pyrinomonadaceae bacterium]